MQSKRRPLCNGEVRLISFSFETSQDAALSRIQRDMIVLALGFSAAACPVFGWRIAAGVACGCCIGYVNFQLLKRVVGGLVEKTVASGLPQSGKKIIVRFFLRYLAVACAAYVILTSYPASLYGFLAGLFLPVAAILLEAVYELYLALARSPKATS